MKDPVVYWLILGTDAMVLWLGLEVRSLVRASRKRGGR